MPITRSANREILPYDPEIERTLRNLRKQARRKLEFSALATDFPSSSHSDLEEKPMAQNRTLKELGAPNLDQQPLCITFPALDANVQFELKSGLIHLLPSFHGLAGKDPHKHLKEFHVVCSSMKPTGVTEEQIKLRAFPFSLKDSAKDWLYEEQIKLRAFLFSLKDSTKDWLYYLPSGSITTWNDLKTMFLEKYFPASRAANIRKEICGIRQHNGESLYEYWERFKKFCASSPHHQITEQLLSQYFYEGLFPTDRSMIDAASGGALVDKTSDAAKNLIANMAANSQQFGNRLVQPSKQMNEVSISNLEQQVAGLTTLVRQLPIGNMQTVKACGICSVVGHQTDACPTLQEEPIEYVKQETQLFQQETNSNFQETKASIQNLERQMGQLATTVSRLEAQSSGKLPSQTVVNPRENASAIVLRSGKEIEGPANVTPSVDQEKEETSNNENSQGKFPNPSDNKPTPPFPQALLKSKKEAKDVELYETFKNYEVNIPLLDAIKQVPRYAKFLKELCTTKRKQKSKRGEKVIMGKNVSTVIQSKLPEKCKDPGMFTIPCMIGDTRLEKAMLDLGASINVMPYSVYASLKLGPLNKTSVVIQLADRSNAYPRGVIEDVLLQVNNLIFPTDFYVLDMENNDHSAPILLGRPFLKTAKTKIDIHSGTLTMEFDGNIVTFNIYDAMKCPSDDNSAYSIDILDSLVEEVFEFDGNDELKVVISEHLERGIMSLL
ncbi:uncharacterized protein LOC116001211 [Ipomoea triloba]|uniref:uncharacterized protein LOC116001211 n=1 Tax=Ipomoea triloba TaxID=35885 RepID=UPI00125D0046|nr:uncharacterized protein LOC116001211 [Ipomoea triloba]